MCLESHLQPPAPLFLQTFPQGLIVTCGGAAGLTMVDVYLSQDLKVGQGFRGT